MATGDDTRAAAGEQPDPVEAIRELATRFIEPIYVRFSRFSRSRPSGPPELLPGQLAPSAPIAVPVPDGSHIVGTVVQDGDPTTVLDAPLSADAVLAFYRERLAALGWREQEMPDRPAHRQGGFMHGRALTLESVMFFQSPRGPSLNVMAALEPRPGALTEVRLMFRIRPPDRMQGPLHRHSNALELIPPLDAPEGAEQQGGGGGGGGGTWRTNATLYTDRDLAAVAAHYEAQLAQGGWQVSRSGVTPPVAWSTWTLADKEGEPWRGFLVILRHPEVEHHYALDLCLDWAGGEPDAGGGGGGWTQGSIIRPLR